MFLTELKEQLDRVQTERGNVPLSHARVMHGNTVLVAHYEGDDDEDPAPETENRAKLVSIADAEGVAGTLQERLESAGPMGIVSLTGEELAQLLEYKTEVTMAALEATKEDVDAERQKTNAALADTMQRAAAKLPADVVGRLYGRGFDMDGKPFEVRVPDLEGKGKEVRMPCPQFDGNKVGCVLPFGHEGDHNFDPSTVDQAQQPETLQE